MKKDCVLIATIPSLANMEKVENVFQNPSVKEVRFNTGVPTITPVEQTLEMLQKLSTKYQKKLWIDIKGRQLRVAKWADPLYSCIELNHEVEILYPAQICFRNGDKVNIMHIKEGKKVLVDPLPKQALGAGQSVNIIAKELSIKGYLTEQDIKYLRACAKLGITNIMASFVEKFDDLAQILSVLPKANIVSKIESIKGVQFISQYSISGLMAARDDLYIECGQGYHMLEMLNRIIKKDRGAICASKIFTSLEKRERVDFADFADLELMYQLGYRKFMLCDNICNYHFAKAIEAWREFCNG